MLARHRADVTREDVVGVDDLRARGGGDFDRAAFSARRVNRDLRLRFAPRPTPDG